jgi:hypothetical protein
VKLARVTHPVCLVRGCGAPATRGYLYAPGSDLLHYRCEAHPPAAGCFEAGYVRLSAPAQTTKTAKTDGQDQLDLFDVKP